MHDAIEAQTSGRWLDAQRQYLAILQEQPDHAAAHSNLGIVLKNLGQLHDAVASYRRALNIKPTFGTHYNLGNALRGLGQYENAVMQYRQALAIRPDYVDALNQLALVLHAQGRIALAVACVRESLRIKESNETKSIFVACVSRLRLNSDDPDLRINLVRALMEAWGRAGQLVPISLELIKLSPDINAAITRSVHAWPEQLGARDLFGANGLAALESDALLVALLTSAPLCDVNIERFLTMARRTILDAAYAPTSASQDNPEGLRFYGALTSQCFINEYVYSHTDDELERVTTLRDTVGTALERGEEVPAMWLMAVAAYLPLHTLSNATRLLDRHWPDEVKAVLTQQVEEPFCELQLRAAIAQATNIENEVSRLVQCQYEENPYPRWIKMAPGGEPRDIVAYLRQRFPQSQLTREPTSGYCDILIAGCGTGQHPITTAQLFRSARVLAIDLSLSSLAYAKRKTVESGLTSIEYAQADLLKLSSLQRSFDVIESCGVLHHLADPWVGWQALLSQLCPGGFMKLGFYSEVARRNVVRIRAFIAERGYGTTASEIRRCRQDLMDERYDADNNAMLATPDFYSMSTCRDLLFHVQEHRMTLTSIDAFLKAHSLVLLGFEIDGDTLHAYQQRFPNDLSATNLDQWQVFEHENPITFAGMYQFWIQKPNRQG